MGKLRKFYLIFSNYGTTAESQMKAKMVCFLTTECVEGEGVAARMITPVQNRAPLSFLDSFFLLKLRENRNSLPDIPPIFCAVQLRVISEKHFF